MIGVVMDVVVVCVELDVCLFNDDEMCVGLLLW